MEWHLCDSNISCDNIAYESSSSWCYVCVCSSIFCSIRASWAFRADWRACILGPGDRVLAFASHSRGCSSFCAEVAGWASGALASSVAGQACLRSVGSSRALHGSCHCSGRADVPQRADRALRAGFESCACRVGSFRTCVLGCRA